ncbi:GNAT family N-acetyltransferase [Aestuariivirga litoralis]|uniref:GNAT family N-acetyltransferase n=1 Tax=Aestuariivirga litoralis TaxID=2650924 RepID=UPI0018C7F3F4|nr:GNAT family N-acetyltransferase [Aestuariivirga litoralis]MBG1231222.1 GNAT family N-acetyltransferase [Aestuariivirga litoralis]
MLAGVWQKLKVERSGEAWAQVAGAWRELATAALEPVGIYGPEFASALLTHHPSAELLTISDGASLLLAMPVQAKRGHDSVLATDVTPSTLPLVTQHGGQEAVLAFLNAQKQPFRFVNLPEDSAFFVSVQAQAQHFAFIRRWHRAALKISGTYEAWAEKNFDTKRRKEWRRLYKRLTEQGAFEVARLDRPDNLQGLVDDYLALEAKGWKGRAGTALQLHADTAAQFRQICTQLAAVGKLRFWTFKLNGKAIASLVGLVEGPQAWIFKIAYDEDFAKFSPGVLVVLEATKDFFADGNIRLVDSCAIPGHPMIDRLWPDRLAFADVLVAPQRVSAARFAVMASALKSVSRLRHAAKPLYLKLKGRKLS